MQIFLFDLDGVLLNSAGYHRSLVETVRQLSLTLGFGDRGLTQSEIDAFESRDITAEWDSSALCAALLLITAWAAGDDVSLPLRPPLGPPRPERHAFPDVLGFLAEFDGRARSDPLPEAETILLRRLGRHSADRAERIVSLLRDARRLEGSLTFRLVQVFNLGGQRFKEIYGEAAGITSPSFLETYDLPTLSEGERSGLFRALSREGRAAAIVTNRPSASPGTIFNTPEAEIGVRAAGFDHVARIAAGDLGWPALEMGRDVQAFLKPSPVHMLAGLRTAIGDDRATAVEMAIRLAESGGADPAWSELDGSRIALFEDAPKGHTSARAAVGLLQRNGVRVGLDQFGIAASRDKIEALRAVGARPMGHVAEALDTALPGWRA
jgi:phosphoglycolate phosphatase-like HAD superfamily hydrolase